MVGSRWLHLARRRAAPIVVLGLVWSGLLQAPAAAGAGSGPILIQGRLVRAGQGAPGALRVYVKGYPSTDPRDEGALRLLSEATAASDGGFSLTLADDARLRRIGKTNGGYVAFTVFGYDGGGVATAVFSRRFDGVRWRSAHREQPLRIDLSQARADPELAARMPSCLIWAYLIKTGNYWTDVGEYHSTKNMSGTFTYGKTADSDIGVGTSIDYGSTWSIKGTVHAGNSLGASYTWTIPADKGNRVRSIFEYDWNDWYCDALYLDTEVTAEQWNGSQTVGDDNHFLDYQCDDKHAQYENTIIEGGSFDRLSKDFVTFSWAAKVFGYDAYTSQSGASTWVQLHLHSDKYAHIICGDDDFPVRSHRVYAGK